MKLATYKDGSRDGQLLVVSRDLTTAHFANGIAGRLQTVLDDWNFLSPQLEDLYITLNHGKARHAFAFDPAHCMAPLPRAYQHLCASAWLAHAERLAPPDDAARDAARAGDRAAEPLLRQATSDDLLGPSDDAVFVDAAAGIDIGPGLAAVLGDVPCGVTPAGGIESVRLLMLVNHWAQRGLPANSPDAHPASAFGPVAVTPDELGAAWQGGRVQLTLQTRLNGKAWHAIDTAQDMHFHFGQLIACAARQRRLRSGTLLAAGVVSARDPAGGLGCIAEKRALEQLAHGSASTPWLQFGDTLSIELKSADGQSPFGAIRQTVSDPS